MWYQPAMVYGVHAGRPSFNRARGLTSAVAVFTVGLLLGVVALASPEIHHTPPKFEPGADLTIRAKITAAGGVIEPSLYFRKSGREYTRVALAPKAHGFYEAKIPSSLLTGGDSLDYYIGAFAAKDLSEGFWRSKAAPYRLSLKVAEQHVLHITTEPANAILDIDKETVGPSPYNAPLSPGSHHVTARLSGYKTLDFEFTMPKDRDLSLPFSLARETAVTQTERKPAPVVEQQPVEPKPEPPAPVVEAAPMPKPVPAPTMPPPSPVAKPPEGMARVRIVSVPEGAHVAVDGKESGTTPVELVLSPGAYIVSAKLDGYRSSDSVVKLGPGDAALRVITLRPAAAKAAQK